MSRRRRSTLIVLVSAVVLLLTGCASMPTSGPVVKIAHLTTPAPDSGFAITPRGPQKGASPTEIVQGFLDAMQATPVQTTTARQFLSSAFADAWDPQRETVTYSDLTPPHGSQVVTVDLSDANHLDAQGGWQGTAGMADSQLHFAMVQEKGEWRISSAPNALIVPQSWFDARFTQVSLYFFDPSGRILVPEPVFVPRGQQLATTLVRALVAGPSDALAGVARTFLPTGVSAGLSVPVDGNGVASVDLKGDPGQLSDHAVHLMSAQLAWTLRQDDSIEAIRLSIGDRPVDQTGGGVIPVDTGAQYDPAGYDSSARLYGIVGGAAVEAASDKVAPLPGALGTGKPALRTVAVSLDTAQAAGVTSDGRALRSSLLEGGAAAKVRLTGTDLLRPAWDFAGRLWDVDRTAQGAVVHVSDGDRMRRIVVPGVTGQNVRRFLVSRDGSRLIALVRHGDGDEVVVSRIRSSDQGKVLGASGTQVISDLGDGARIRDIGWHSPTTVVTLQQLSGTALIRTLSVDGAVSGFPAVTLTVGDRLRNLAASPVAGENLYGVSASSLVDLSGDTGTTALAGPVTALGYAG
ncbi:LpqB family beta-propeller domain-containing protein [Nocardioides sp. BP30]|uniref:LpqB family beta-propeller domain-containing protein n=1 Tax=Nocardioides sp. BP30 TaxID=3036374 RepID=UPI002468B05D|nr:LpqB family beta-propeller domain-containing protein [Nocardioides sp. BP30]WGL51498.1 LpqB family beta-propeller domain-containing protein [Nocardioides sp. BP30]